MAQWIVLLEHPNTFLTSELSVNLKILWFTRSSSYCQLPALTNHWPTKWLPLFPKLKFARDTGHFLDIPVYAQWVVDCGELYNLYLVISNHPEVTHCNFFSSSVFFPISMRIWINVTSLPLTSKHPKASVFGGVTFNKYCDFEDSHLGVFFQQQGYQWITDVLSNKNNLRYFQESRFNLRYSPLKRPSNVKEHQCV